MRVRLRAALGITLFEVALMLTATSALVAALMPTLTATIRHAEIAESEHGHGESSETRCSTCFTT